MQKNANSVISLKNLVSNFKSEFDLTPCVGAEIEFYLIGIENELQLLKLEQQSGLKIQKERGQSQYEVQIPHSINIEYYPKIIQKMRVLISNESTKIGIKAIFDPKPFKNDFGSSMHIHLNFLEKDYTEQCAKILCHYLPHTIKAFLPGKKDYLRLDSKFMAPTHISWGGNNRTTLIRIPGSYPKRLEHRLASANANPYEVIYTILFSIYNGFKNSQYIKNLEKTYGNAYEAQYNLVPISRYIKR